MFNRADIRRRYFGTKLSSFLSTLVVNQVGVAFPLWLYLTISADLEAGFSAEIAGVVCSICGAGALLTWAFFIEPLRKSFPQSPWLVPFRCVAFRCSADSRT